MLQVISISRLSAFVLTSFSLTAEGLPHMVRNQQLLSLLLATSSTGESLFSVILQFEKKKEKIQGKDLAWVKHPFLDQSILAKAARTYKSMIAHVGTL